MIVVTSSLKVVRLLFIQENHFGPPVWHGAETESIMLTELMEAHREIGRILDNPTSYGLAERAPQKLVDTLTVIRTKLMNEIRSQTDAIDFDLEAELSQDADRGSPVRNSRSF